MFDHSDKYSLHKRVAELSALEDGWLNGEGKSLDKAGLARISDLFIQLHEQDNLPIPYLYPTPNGGVYAEWTINFWELSASIDLVTGQADLHAVYIPNNSRARAARSATLHTPEGSFALVDFIVRASGRKQPPKPLEIGDLVIFVSPKNISRNFSRDAEAVRGTVCEVVNGNQCKVLKTNGKASVSIGDFLSIRRYSWEKLDPNNKEHAQIIYELELQRD